MGQVVFTATLSFDRNSTDQLSFIQTFVQIKVHPISTCHMAHLIYVLPVVRRWTIFVMETACSVPCVDTSAAFIYHVEAIPWSGCIHHDPVLVSVWTDLPTSTELLFLGQSCQSLSPLRRPGLCFFRLEDILPCTCNIVFLTDAKFIVPCILIFPSQPLAPREKSCYH